MNNFRCFVFVLLSAATSQALDLAVRDEEGMPVENAAVEAAYETYHEPDNKTASGNTGKNGSLHLSTPPTAGAPWVALKLKVSKSGFYHALIKDMTPEPQAEATAIMIRKVINPRPLFARKMILLLPQKDAWFGYDLECGDWVAPDGKGQHVDLRLKGGKVVTGDQAWASEIQVAFPGQHDGICALPIVNTSSALRLTRVAPDDGYSGTWRWHKGLNPDSGYHTHDKHEHYVLRVRTVLNEDGSVRSAQYAKIADQVDVLPGILDPNAAPALEFTYYFNPTPNDRNLEFDPKRNLFGNLPVEEQVFAP